MSARLRNPYLHPHYNYQSPWNSKITRRHGSLSAKTRLFEQPHYHNPPPLSPVGLTEVLSSYTPGPTVIMIEKKKKPSLIQSKYIQTACVILLALWFIFWLGSTALSKTENRYSFRSAPIELNLHDKKNLSQTDNLTGYTYVNPQPHFKYANVILSFDEDDEAFVEDVRTYSGSGIHY